MAIIYLDNAATTKVAPEVAAVLSECLTGDFGNPSSAHHMGIDAERRVKQARDQLLAAIGDPGGRRGRIVWTSGGTEGDALGVIGAARASRGRHVVYSAIEHPAVSQSAALLAGEGWRIDVAPVDRAGRVVPDRLAELIDSDTAVVAIMLVNNEIGTVQPMADLVEIVRGRSPDAHIHCDAVQALGKMELDVAALGVDSLAFAAHKLHGPKGVGALWLGERARLAPLWGGGGHQGGLRSGTLNVPGIAAMGEAVRLAYADDTDGPGLADRRQHWRKFGETVLAALRDAGVEVAVNGGADTRSPHILSLALPGLPAEPLLHVLESRGVLVSAGSACSERDRKGSPVLASIGQSQDVGTLRLSFGRDTDRSDITRATEILVDAIREF